MKIKLTNEFFHVRKKIFVNLMRTFLFLFCTTVFSFSSNDVMSQNTNVVIDSDKLITVDEVFEIIKSQTDYTFLYQEDLFKNSPKIKLKKGKIKANKLLQKSLLDGDFNFIVTENNTIIIRNKRSSRNDRISGQQIITGKITDENGVPIAGASVFVSNVQPASINALRDDFIRGTATDFEGFYSIQGEVGNFISASSIGFEFFTTQISTGETQIDIVLKESASKLDEVFVVGYGTTKKKDLTGSVGSVDSKQIEQIQTQSIDQALIGKVSGVFVGSSSGGGLGSEGFVHIRGLSQLRGDNQPLYVIDGVPIQQNPQFEDGLGFYAPRTNPLLAINPSDIERVDVLKDASSAAIYGSRAANGVILITTKKGKLNQKSRFTYSLNTTIQNPTKLRKAQGPDQFRELIIANANSQFNPNNPTAEPINTILNNPNDFFGTSDTDWQDLLRNKNALWTQHNISVSGGNESTSYLISARASNQEGVIKGHDFKRYSLNSNLDSQVSERIKVGLSLNYNYGINDNNAITSLNQGVLFRPDLGLYDEEGNPSGYYDGDFFVRNPVLDGLENTARATSQSLLANIYGEIELLKNLKFRSSVSINVSDDRTRDFSQSFTRKAYRVAQNLGMLSDVSGNLDINTTSIRSSTFSNTLNYNTTIGDKHSIDAIGGVSWDQSSIDLEANHYYGFPDDDILTDIRSASLSYEPDSQFINNALNSIFGRVNYNYDDRYLVTFTGRRDGSIKFGPNNRYGFFPSGAIAWNAHNESFLEDSNLISQLKLRASLGRTGADNLPAFSYSSTLTTLTWGDSQYAGVNGIAPTGLPNPNVGWESTDQLDLGVEFGLLNNRINAEIVYFEKNTSGLILAVPVAPETGFAMYNANIADVSNKGWEVTVGADVLRSQDFRWNSSFNISFIKNKVENLYNGTAFGGIIEGQPIGVLTGLKVIGIAQTQEEIDKLNAAAPNGIYHADLKQPGDYIFEDVDGSGNIGYTLSQDRQVLGDINPKYFGGWNNDISFKNWTASMNFQFVQGNSRAWGELSQYNLDGRDFYGNNPTFVSDLLWSPTNRDAEYARLGSLNNGVRPVDPRFASSTIVDGSYIRLRSASIGYNIPEKLLDRIGLASASMTLSGNNLFTITNYPGLDPENVDRPRGGATIELTQDNGYSYPTVRTFTFGLNISF